MEEPSDEFDQPFLPQGGCARAIAGCLAFPSFLFFTALLIAFPTILIPWPPANLDAALTLFAICQLLAAGSMVSLLAIIWAIAAPQWIVNLLVSGSRLLISITGGFLLSNGVALVAASISYRQVATFVIGVSMLILGPYILWTNVRRSRKLARTEPLKTP